MSPVNREWAEKQAREDRATGGKRPLLTPEVTGGENLLRLTVMCAEGYRRGTMFAVEFREWPGYILWAKGQGLINLADELGPDESDWPGRRVTIEQVVRHYNGRAFHKYDFASSAAAAESVVPPIRRLRKRVGE